jgi:hypothetical protein
MLFSLLNALLKPNPVFADARLRECTVRKAGQADSLNGIVVERRRRVRRGPKGSQVLTISSDVTEEVAVQDLQETFLGIVEDPFQTAGQRYWAGVRFLVETLDQNARRRKVPNQGSDIDLAGWLGQSHAAAPSTNRFDEREPSDLARLWLDGDAKSYRRRPLRAW